MSNAVLRRHDMKIIAMIPARMGSQRLKQKNLQQIDGAPILAHAVRKCYASEMFDEVWVNSESDVFGEIANEEGASFHKRPDELANDMATSEDFIYEFLTVHECNYVVQVHSIAPLLTKNDVISFVKELKSKKPDVLLSCEEIQIECSYNGKPVNFTYDEKTNSQELDPVQRITWSITAWKRETYMKAYEAGKCATYSGEIAYFPVNKLAAHVIKTQHDLDIASALWGIMPSE
jgi:CMP-N-acetylneuraminic acid synthetase